MKITEFLDQYDLRGGLLVSVKQKSNDLEMKVNFGGKKTIAQEMKFDVNSWTQKNDMSGNTDTSFNLSGWKQKNDISNSDMNFNLNNWTQNNSSIDPGANFNIGSKKQTNNYSSETEKKTFNLVFQNIFEFESEIPARKFNNDPITDINITPQGPNSGELIVRVSVERPEGIKSFKFLGRRMEFTEGK